MDPQLVNNLDELEKLFASRMREYEDKLLKATVVSSPVHPDISSLSKDFNDFKSFVCQSLSLIRKQLDLVTYNIDKHETAMRRKILLIHGFSERQNEKLHESVYKLFSDQMKVTDLKVEDIQICHRLGSSQASTRPVLVKFGSLESRRLVWDNKTSLKGSGITISEFLTKTRHKVFMTARKHFGIKNCWSVEGKIVIILPDKSRQRIESMAELKPLICRYPDKCSTVNDPGQSKEPTSPKEVASRLTTNAPRKARRRN